uniref:PDZ domain-containing protein n=1 Tax=Macrostomum lignano TaxID=282301 RepID=A0A1I8IGD9_9PLAT
METTPPRSPGGRVTSLAQDGSPASCNASSWGAPRIVRIRRDAGQSLGISIVGGRVAGHGLQHSVSGIFIKHVSGQDLRDATHDEAVDAIRSAPSPVEFCVQSLVNPSCPTDSDSAVAKPASPDRQQQQPPPTRTQQIISEVPAWDETKRSSTETNKIQEVSQCANSDSDSDEDEFGYPLKWPEKRLAKKYVDINGQILRNRRNLGISLAGNRDTSKMSVFVCGIRPDGAAAEDGRLRIGDELL